MHQLMYVGLSSLHESGCLERDPGVAQVGRVPPDINSQVYLRKPPAAQYGGVEGKVKAGEGTRRGPETLWGTRQQDPFIHLEGAVILHQRQGGGGGGGGGGDDDDDDDDVRGEGGEAGGAQGGGGKCGRRNGKER